MTSAGSATSTIHDIVNEVQLKLGYNFQNPACLLEALKAAGSGLNFNQSHATIDGNKRLAQLGNATIRTVVLAEWYRSGAPRGNPSEHI